VVFMEADIEAKVEKVHNHGAEYLRIAKLQ
jgi:hypothetical protein